VLRPYQREAVDVLYAYRQRGGGEGLIVIPTGSGKSPVVAHAFRLPRRDAARLIAATRSIEWRRAPHPCEATEGGL
jgi:DNA repair protein RadD